MRRFEESFEGEFKQAIEIGQDNAICLSQMARWCKHVELEPTSQGLYGQITELPIGSYSVACPKVSTKLESSRLRGIVSDFLTKNCAGCPHHTPNGDISWGQEIIETRRRELEQRERAARKEVERITELRAELRSRTKHIAEGADHQSQSILQFLEGIFSEDEFERDEASEQIRQAAKLGADIIPRAGIELILFLARSDRFSAVTLPVCAELATRRPDLGAELCGIAFDNIRDGLQVEPSASVLDALGDSVPYPLKDVHLRRLIFSQEHSWLRLELSRVKPRYVHSTAVLARSFDAEPNALRNIIRVELQNESDEVRFQLCGAIELLQEQRPEIAQQLLSHLVRSLELREESSLNEAPSHRVISILHSAFLDSPQDVDRLIAKSINQVRPAVQPDLVGVYRFPLSARETLEKADLSTRENVAAQRLMSWVMDDELSLETRFDAVNELKTLLRGGSPQSFRCFEALLGYLATASIAESPPARPSTVVLPGEPKDPWVEQMESQSDIRTWELFKARLVECLKVLCAAKPSEAFELIASCFNQPLGQINSDFKARCVPLLSQLGKEFLIRPKVMPLIWQALMDSDSPRARANAVDAVVDCFPTAVSPPANLVEIMRVYLLDENWVVHMAAVRAVSRRPRWFTESRPFETLRRLIELVRVYRDEKYELGEISDAIIGIGRVHRGIKAAALRTVESIFPIGEKYLDRQLVNDLTRFCDPGESLAQFVARDIGTYLRSYSREYHYDYKNSARFRMFTWLHQLPAATFQRIANDLLLAGLEVATRDAWESGCFASVFARFRAFVLERDVLEKAANSIPEEPRNEARRALFFQLANAAARNAQLQTRETEGIDGP